MQVTDNTKQKGSEVEIKKEKTWLTLKLEIMQCLLMIANQEELRKWQNHLLKNIKIKDKQKVKEIAVMMNNRMDQLKFKNKTYA
jgi:hypothetical protein